MSNEVTTQSNAPAANPFATAGAGAGNAAFVKFNGASGDFTYGQDDEELEHGTLLAADVANAFYTWAFWWDGEVLETRTIRVDEDPRAFEHEPDDLPADYDDEMTIDEIRVARKADPANFRDGWSCQGCVTMRSLEGEMAEYLLKLNAGVALRSYQSMLGNYGRFFLMKPGKQPIIEIGSRKYKSKVKGVGTRHAPDLKISDWKSEEELMMAAGENPDDYGDDAGDDDEKPAAIEGPADEDVPTSARGRRGRGSRGNYAA